MLGSSKVVFFFCGQDFDFSQLFKKIIKKDYNLNLPDTPFMEEEKKKVSVLLTASRLSFLR